MILRNNHFLEMLPSLRNVAVPGAHYRDITRAEIAGDRAASLEDPELFDSELYETYRQRLEKHSEAHSMFERELDRDRWLLVNEHRTEEGTVVLYTDISELKRREREIRHLAYHDVLTNLPNRMLFHERIEEALTRAQERNTTAAIMCLDLDNFKYVNDTLGHSAGDDLLKCVSSRLRSCLRDTDTIARLGGDEFGIVITDLNDAEYATSLAWRLSDAVNQPIDLNGQRVNISVSIGIATSTNGDTTSDRLLKDADLALYRAKADGRATFRFFEAEMDARAQERRMLEMDLRHAVAKDQLELHYQAQVDIFSSEIMGFEALVRWNRPGSGMVSPAQLHPACRGDRHHHGSRRVGAAQGVQRCRRLAFAGPRGGERIAGTIQGPRPGQARCPHPAGNGLPAARLELEITESLLLKDVDENLNILQELKNLGVRISMDDFGTGYSSLMNLRSFPFDKIKIDQSFVGDIERRPDAAAIVRAVVALGNSLGMVTCAEGVETGEQLSYLRSEGCVEMQGFYYSKPKPLADVVAMMRATHAKLAIPLQPVDFEEYAVTAEVRLPAA